MGVRFGNEVGTSRAFGASRPRAAFVPTHWAGACAFCGPEPRQWAEPAREFHAWKSYWAADPDGKCGSSGNPALISIRSARDTPCLVLLGEPGIGTVVRDNYNELAASISLADGIAIRHDLTSFGSEDRIVRTILSVTLPAHASEEVQSRGTDLWETLICGATRASW